MAEMYDAGRAISKAIDRLAEATMEQVKADIVTAAIIATSRHGILNEKEFDRIVSKGFHAMHKDRY